MFVIGVYEPRGATPETAARTVDRQFDRSFSNQPHFVVHMVVYGVRRSARPKTTYRTRAWVSLVLLQEPYKGRSPRHSHFFHFRRRRLRLATACARHPARR